MKTMEQKNLLKQLGKQLKKIKIDNNRTTKEIASLLNITPQAYGNIERGESGVCVSKLIILAAYYKKPLIDFIPFEYRNFESQSEIKDQVRNGKKLFVENILINKS